MDEKQNLTATKALLKLVEFQNISLDDLNNSQKDKHYGTVLTNVINSVLEENRRYSFIEYAGIGGESPVLKIFDNEDKQFYAAKFLFPLLSKNAISRMIHKVRRYRNFQNKNSELVQAAKNYNSKQTKAQNLYTMRFRRSYINQKSVCSAIQEDDLGKYGNTPTPIIFAGKNIIFYIMQYINGKSVLDYCAENKERERLLLFYKVVCLINYSIHDHGMMHCDISANNIIVAAKGTPYILDFFLSKNMNENENLTIQGKETHFKLNSSPVKQIKDFYDRDQLCDVFSLGILLWIIITCTEINVGIDRDKYSITEFYEPNMLPTGLRKIFLRCMATDEKIEGVDPYEDIVQLREEVKAVLDLYNKTDKEYKLDRFEFENYKLPLEYKAFDNSVHHFFRMLELIENEKNDYYNNLGS